MCAANKSSPVAWFPTNFAITGYLYEFVSLSFPFYGAEFFQLASAASMYLFFKDIKPPEERTKGTG